MGEDSRPDLVIVQPMTKGTGNHTGPTVPSSFDGNGGNKTIVIEVPLIIDCIIFGRAVKKVALEESLQV